MASLMADAPIVKQLVAMGFPRSLCQSAAIVTGNISTAAAVEWLLSQDIGVHPSESAPNVAGRGVRSSSVRPAGGAASTSSSGMGYRALWKSPARASARRPQLRLGPDHQAQLPEVSGTVLPPVRTKRRPPAPTDMDSAISAIWQPSADVAAAAARDTAATLTAAAYGPIGSFCFVSPCNCDLGLFARAPLRSDQFICEYDGPRLPQRLQVPRRGSNWMPALSLLSLADRSSSTVDGAGARAVRPGGARHVLRHRWCERELAIRLRALAGRVRQPLSRAERAP